MITYKKRKNKTKQKNPQQTNKIASNIILSGEETQSFPTKIRSEINYSLTTLKKIIFVTLVFALKTEST